MKNENQSRISIFLISILVWLSSFIVYCRTLSPNLSSQSDSGELVTAVTLPGLAHPPGYPLYTILGFLFSHLPQGNPAFRINLMSAFFSSLAVVLIFLTAMRFYRKLSISASISLLFAFSRDFWKLSLSAEVFSLFIFFVTLLIYLLITIRDRLIAGETAKNSLFLFFFIWGLAFSHHHTVVFLIPAFIYFALSEKMLSFVEVKKALPFAPFFLILGLLPYLYLPLGAKLDPPLNWGDPGTIEGFMRVVTRAGYGTFSLGKVSSAAWSFQTFLYETFYYLKTLSAQFTPALLLLGISGGVIMGIHERKWLYFFTIILIFYSLAFILLSRFPSQEGYLALLERFFLPSYLAFVFMIGRTLDFIYTRGGENLRKALNLALLAVPVIVALIQFDSVDRHNNYVAWDYGRNILQSLDKNALLFVRGDAPCASLLYCQNIENNRRDVVIVFEGLLSSPWYARQLSVKLPELTNILENGAMNKKSIILTMTRALKDRRSVFFNHPEVYPELNVSCEGLVYRLVEGREHYSFIECEALQQKLKRTYRYHGDYGRAPDYFTKELIRLYGLSYYYLGKSWKEAGEREEAISSLDEAETRSMGNTQILFLIGESYMELDCWDRAEKIFKKCREIMGEAPEIYMNLAVVYARRGDVEESKKALRRMKELQGDGGAKN